LIVNGFYLPVMRQAPTRGRHGDDGRADGSRAGVDASWNFRRLRFLLGRSEFI